MMKHGITLIALLLLSCLTICSQDNTMTLRLMTYNICHGAGLDDVIDLNRQANVIRDAAPDVVGLQEVDSCVKRSGWSRQRGGARLPRRSSAAILCSGMKS